MIYSNPTVKQKPRKVAALENFRGLDTAHSPMNLSYGHAMRMENLIDRNGMNRKRKGWRTDLTREDFPISKLNPPKTFKIEGVWNGDLYYGDRIENTTIYAYYTSSESGGIYNNTYIPRFFAKLPNLENEDVTVATVEFNYDDLKEKHIFEPIRFSILDNKVYAVGCGYIFQLRPRYVHNVSLQKYQYELDVYLISEDAKNQTNIRKPNTLNLGGIRGTEPKVLKTYPVTVDEYRQSVAKHCTTDLFMRSYDAETDLDNSVAYVTETGTTETFPSFTDNDINMLSRDVVNTCKISLSLEDLTINQIQENQKESTPIIQAYRLNQMKLQRVIDYNPAHLTEYANQIRVEFYEGGQFKKRVEKFTLGEVENGYENGYEKKTVGLYVPVLDGAENPTNEMLKGLCFDGKNFCVDVNRLVQYSTRSSNGQIRDFEFKVVFPRRISHESKKQTDELMDAKMVTMFGANGNPNRMFLCNGRNTIYYSEYRDPTYFSPQNTITLGSTDITDWIKGSETTLYVFKAFSQTEESLFTLDGELVISENNPYRVDEGEVVFRNKGYFLPESAVNYESAVNLANDTLIVSNDGIYGIELSARVASTERFARSRAEQIKNLLNEYNLKESTTIVWDNKVFVAVEDGTVFVGDAKYRTRFEGDMADTFNYEWWMFKHVPVKLWFVEDEKLRFISTDDTVCEFYDGFADIERADEVLASFDEFNNITVATKYAGYNKVDFGRYENNPIEVSHEDIVGFADNGVVMNESVLYDTVDIGNDYVVVLTKKGLQNASKLPVQDLLFVRVKDINDITHVVTFTKGNGDAILFTNYIDGCFDLMDGNVDVQYNISISSAEEDNAVVFDSAGNPCRFSDRATSDTAFMTLYREAPVVARWETGSYDFGTSMSAKTIESFSIAFDRYSPKEMNLYFSTANNGAPDLMKSLRKQLDFDLSAMSFLRFTFDKRFESSYTRRFLIRNVNFISFILESDQPEDFSVKSLHIVYKVNRINRGEE